MFENHDKCFVIYIQLNKSVNLKYFLRTFQVFILYLLFQFDINQFSKGNVKNNQNLIKRRIVESLKIPIANLLGKNGYPSH